MHENRPPPQTQKGELKAKERQLVVEAAVEGMCHAVLSADESSALLLRMLLFYAAIWVELRRRRRRDARSRRLEVHAHGVEALATGQASAQVLGVIGRVEVLQRPAAQLAIAANANQIRGHAVHTIDRILFSIGEDELAIVLNESICKQNCSNLWKEKVPNERTRRATSAATAFVCPLACPKWEVGRCRCPPQSDSDGTTRRRIE